MFTVDWSENTIYFSLKESISCLYSWLPSFSCYLSIFFFEIEAQTRLKYYFPLRWLWFRWTSALQCSINRIASIKIYAYNFTCVCGYTYIGETLKSVDLCKREHQHKRLVWRSKRAEHNLSTKKLRVKKATLGNHTDWHQAPILILIMDILTLAKINEN